MCIILLQFFNQASRKSIFRSEVQPIVDFDEKNCVTKHHHYHLTCSKCFMKKILAGLRLDIEQLGFLHHSSKPPVCTTTSFLLLFRCSQMLVILAFHLQFAKNIMLFSYASSFQSFRSTCLSLARSCLSNNHW